jgi:hypothetical protein
MNLSGGSVPSAREQPSPMSRGNSTFKKRDLRTALEAALAAGVEVQKIEITRDGRIIVVAGKPTEQACENTGGNEWDRV